MTLRVSSSMETALGSLTVVRFFSINMFFTLKEAKILDKNNKIQYFNALI